jgi:hypothetical protein
LGEGLVRQNNLGAWADGVQPQYRLNRRGEIIVPDFYQQLVMDGRVFQINNAAIETADAIGTTSFATNGTNPMIYLGVPVGTSIMPLEIRIVQGGTIANDAFTVVINYEDAAPAAASGTAKTPINLRTDRPVTSSVTALAAATITAPADDALLHAGIYTQMVADPVHSDQDFIWSARTMLAPIIVGSGCLSIYAFTGTTGPSFYWRVVWAEIPTISTI